MAIREIKNNVFYVGAVHWDRRLFDELIPLPDGTSYNAYIIKGSEKIALIDAVDPAVVEQLFYNLKKLNINKIDYIISNHAEQDHSGGIVDVLKRYPEAKVVTNEKCKTMLTDLLLIPEEKFITIKEEEKLSLGNKTLQFFSTPWVHWPETMSTYLIEDNILFSCDFFGSHTATSDIFDEEHFYLSAKRYYAEIMAPFRNNVKTNLEKVKKLDIKIIAPSHGIIYKNPQKIINAYEEWSSDKVKNEAIIAFVSMHDSTKKMAEYLREKLVEKNINVHYFNLIVTDIGSLAMTLLDAATFVLGTPTMLAGVHPTAAYAAYLFNILRPKTKFVSLITSFGWSEKASETIKNMITNFKGEILKPVIAKGHPKENDFIEIERLANDIENKHKEINLLN